MLLASGLGREQGRPCRAAAMDLTKPVRRAFAFLVLFLCCFDDNRAGAAAYAPLRPTGRSLFPRSAAREPPPPAAASWTEPRGKAEFAGNVGMEVGSGEGLQASQPAVSMERCDSSNRLSATQTQFLLPTAAPRRTLAVAASTAFLLAAAALSTLSTPSRAVSGGGLDYANLDITGQDFSNGNYKGKDFTQVIAKTTNFAGSNLQGCRFYKAFLVKANFEGSDLRGASLEDTSLDGASFKNAVVAGAYFSSSVLDAGSVENADFTDAQFPLKTIPLLCDRPDLKGTNPVTGAYTRESVMCP